MDDLLVSTWAAASLVCVGMWLVVTIQFQRLPRLGLLHQVVVLLTVIVMSIYDIIIAALVYHWGPEWLIRMALTFAIGIQMVDALAAVLFLRLPRREAK